MQNFRGMKFSRMLPRPLETFHSVDEKRPRITFTKYIRGDSQRFRWKVARSFLSFFPLPSLCVEYNFMARLLKKKKKRKSPIPSPSLSREGRARRRSNGRMEKKMKKGRQEVCFFPRCVKRVILLPLEEELTNPELAHLEGCKCSGG